MKILETADAMREWSRQQRAQGKRIGFVPTMGALHQGHASLMRQSVIDNGVTVVSIFVNPTQFGPNEDLNQYPRTMAEDQKLCERIGVDAIYYPDTRAMYPEGYATYVSVERLTDHLCGTARPTHFRGVATVVTKLFNVVEPDRAYFGQKDAQQAAVLRRMTRDLDFSIRIIEMPIIREPDGLAMSSRNRYLSEDERRRALGLSRGLDRARKLLEAGERDVATLRTAVAEEMSEVDIDYIEVVDADEMQPVDRVDGPVFVTVAAQVGPARLIDNLKYGASRTRQRGD